MAKTYIVAVDQKGARLHIRKAKSRTGTFYNAYLFSPAGSIISMRTFTGSTPVQDIKDWAKA